MTANTNITAGDAPKDRGKKNFVAPQPLQPNPPPMPTPGSPAHDALMKVEADRLAEEGKAAVVAAESNLKQVKANEESRLKSIKLAEEAQKKSDAADAKQATADAKQAKADDRAAHR